MGIDESREKDLSTSVNADRIDIEDRCMCVRANPFDLAAPHHDGVHFGRGSPRAIDKGDVFKYRLQLLQLSSMCAVS